MKIKLPGWLQRSSLQLPDWAKVEPNASPKVSLVIHANTDAAMREWIGLLGSPTLDQYWLEVAYQCAKLDLQMALAGSEYDPRISGKPVQFEFSRSEQYAQRRHPVGKGSEAASKGKEARGYYTRIRGNLPM